MNYEYSYSYVDGMDDLLRFGFGMVLVIMIISLIISVVVIAGQWKAFKKAGKPGWAAIIPIYNYVVMIEIAGLPMWYLALFFVPFANIYAIFKINIDFAQKYGKTAGYGVGLVFFPYIFFPILGFGSATYVGASDMNQNVANPNMNQNNYNPNQNVQPQNNTGVKYCPSCGSQMPAESSFCTNCGYKF